MAGEQETEQLQDLLDGLKVDAASYFAKAGAETDAIAFSDAGNELWSALPEQLQQESLRIRQRVTSLMGQVIQAVRTAPLTSSADQRDVATGTKAMRAALMLREFYSWDIEILNDEDVILGTRPAGQSEDRIATPYEAGERFADWAGKIRSILELVAAGGTLAQGAASDAAETARYRPGTAFIMMWMNPDHAELNDVADAVKEVFGQFGIRAIRADDIEHEGLITERILNEIRTSEYCFADLSGERPNVYYEVGFAHALSRRVFLYRKKGTSMHFDLAGYNCPEYENLRDLRRKLTLRLQAVTNREPRAS